METDARAIVVAGASGLIGRALVRRLEAGGNHVVRLVRREAGPGESRWDPQHGEIDSTVVERADAVINLAGAGIGDRRWNERYKQVLVDSRVDSTGLLARTIASTGRPAVFVSASAIGYYGDRGDEELDESSPRGEGFLAELCERWEDATGPAADAGTRVVLLRTGIVMSADGGALKRQLPLFKLGLGATIGSGDQWLSWIGLADHVAAVEHVLEQQHVAGAVDLTAPEPVRNREFTAVLASVLGRPHFLRVPAFAPRLALGREMADHLLMFSQRVAPRRLLDSGFRFEHPDLESALRATVGRGRDAP